MASSLGMTYAAVFISLDLLLVSTTEAPFINQLGKLLLHHLLDLGDGFLQAFLGRACHMQVKGRVLPPCVSSGKAIARGVETNRRRGHALVGIVVATSGDILPESKSQSMLPKTVVCGFKACVPAPVSSLI
jgi:hypothetical protein